MEVSAASLDEEFNNNNNSVRPSTMTTNGHKDKEISGDLTARVQRLHRYVLETFYRDNPTSVKYNARAKELIPTGSTRGVLSYDPFPLSFASGHDVFVQSLDEHEYLDFVSEYCAGMYGHSHPAIKSAIQSVLESGHSLGGCNPKEAELAELLIARFRSVEMIRFCNSGNEANIFAVATALSFTNREKVMVFHGGYHGGSFMFPAHGSRLNIPHKFVRGTFNDIEATRTSFQQHQNDIGAILVEPMQGAGGSILGTQEFLEFLRSESSRLGAVLIFDEVITSRVRYGGLQDYFKITPDMTTMGKHFGGGLAFGAFGGRKDISEYSPGLVFVMAVSAAATSSHGVLNGHEISLNRMSAPVSCPIAP
jgi:glutamate-1-semialdehyde 2,1-aminomutase